MAKAFPEEDLLKCAICFEFYTQPRKLPRCGHAFCEVCLLTYVKTLREKNELRGEFLCPFCRTSIQCPKYKNLTEWVKSFALDTKILSKLEVRRSKRHSEICNPCLQLGRSSTAEQFCVDCSDKLCVACTEIHKVFKISKHHRIVEISHDQSQMNREYDLIQTINKHTQCPEHKDRKIEFYCKNHDDMFCATCAIVDHRQCNHIFELTKSVSRPSVDQDASELNAYIGKLGAHANKVVQLLNNTVEANKKQVNDIASTVKDVKLKIVKMVEALELNITQQTSALMKRYSLAVGQDIERIKETMNELRVLQSVIQTVLEAGTNSEAYIVSSKLRKRVNELACSISDIGNTFQSHCLELELDKLVKDLLALGTNRLDRLAKIKESKKSIDMPVLSEKITINPATAHIKKSYTKYIEGEASNPTYCGLAYLENEILLLDSYTDNCSLVNENWKVVANLSLSSDAASITNLRNGLMAVSFPVMKKIFLIAAVNGEMTIKGQLDTKFAPKALCGLQNGDLAISWENPVAFGIVWPYLDLPEKVYFCEDKMGRKIKSLDYMAVDENRSHVIQPCHSEKAVFCFDFEGSPKFKYTHNELEKPRGVALDSYGNVYVCESAKSSVHVISPTGQPVSIVKEEFLKTPLAIGFNPRGDQFAVTQLYFGCCYVTFFEVNQEP